MQPDPPPFSHDPVVEEQMRSLVQSHGLVDAWRDFHSRDFTFFSSPHDSFCRINHVFIPLRFISNIHKITIPSSAWLDHDPLVFLLTLSGLTRPTFQWRLSDSLLTSQDALLKIHTNFLQTFFGENVGSMSSPISLWEAHKATMRGHCIQLASSENVIEKRGPRNLQIFWPPPMFHSTSANKKARHLCS